ncbi:MAG TPA: YchJ family metal-binding protein [Polyangiales bacterium]|nr:YchJ family metal-binding protein [Polyangiales bacterium]
MGVPFQDPSALESHCLPFVEGKKRPETAEELMAARYLAYTRAAVDFLLSTHDPKTRGQADRKAIEAWAKGASWQGLEIVSTVRGTAQDNDGEVEFIARYELDGVNHEHHEKAEFRKIDGVWFFVDGKVVAKQPVRRDTPKIGPNERCSCGSGKKFKKCCGSPVARRA